MPNLWKKITCLLKSLHSSVLSYIPFLFLIYSNFLFSQPERTLPCSVHSSLDLDVGTLGHLTLVSAGYGQ